jgi:S-DNA-T family DNA segregation ATPase FtsK/SpoIIIE
VDAVVRYLKEQGAEHYKPHLEQVTTGSDTGPENPCDQDELFDQAVDIVFATGQASASFLQRRMKVGYSRASRLIDLMADAGIVSEHRGSKAREIIMEPEDWVVLRQRMLQGTPR